GVGYGTLRGLVSGGIQSQLTGQRPNWSAIAAESFGSALGDQVVNGIQSQDRARQQQKAAFAKQVRDWGFSGRAEALEPAWLSMDSVSSEATYAVVDDEPMAQRATAGKAAVTGGNAILPNGERINGRYIGDEADGTAAFVLDTVGVTAERPRHLDEGAWAAFLRGYNGGSLGVMEDSPWSWAGEYGSRATNSFKNLFGSMTGYSSTQLARSQYAKGNYISAAGYTMAAVGEAAQTFLMFGAPVGGMVGTLERGAVARYGEVVPNTTVGGFNRVRFDSSLSEVDRIFGQASGKTISENYVARNSYARLQQQGTEVVYMNDVDFGMAGQWQPGFNRVVVNFSEHTGPSELTSTLIHEAAHQTRYYRGFTDITKYEEYFAFRREALFSLERRPTLFERQDIWNAIGKTPEYINLPVGKVPVKGWGQ
ncbi:hypothetical protein, partial [Chromobacterium haemolyticum]